MSPCGSVAGPGIAHDAIDLEEASAVKETLGSVFVAADCTSVRVERASLQVPGATDAVTEPVQGDGSSQDADGYAVAGIWRRAFPERYIALLVTLVLEIPVTLIVGGGSEALVNKIGLDRYTLLMAFLPLTSAISGNVGLQASALTTRAIALGHCKSANLLRWLSVELGAALLLAVACGVVVTVVASIWTVLDNKTSTDLGFALTIGFAQTFSIAVAGITGTMAPLLFSFLLRWDPGKWAGPMETAVQDIAGTFAVVYLAQWVLMFFVSVGVSPPTVT
jgi:Mg/Co/Ni transporter MgtE